MSEAITASQYKAMQTKAKKSKYGAKKTVRDGITFDSKKEANHYMLLKLMQEQGEIEALELQPWYVLHVGGEKIGRCRFDFRFYDLNRRITRVQDVKGYMNNSDPVTKLFKRNCAHVKAEYNIEVEIV